MRVLSLFDGISCARIALERAGIQVYRYDSCEIDSAAIGISHQNYPNINHLYDVCWLTNRDYDPPVDLLLGGSPCQGFSLAGKGLGDNDNRSRLFHEFIRIKRDCAPEWFLFENTPMSKNNLSMMTEALGVDPVMINSNLVSAQNRKRYYWTNIPIVGLPADRNILLKDILDPPPDGWDIVPKSHTVRASGYGSSDRHAWDVIELVRDQYNVKVFLLDDSTGKTRRLTPLELERLQTLPDNYTAGLSNYKRRQLIGNAWTVDVIAWILGFIPNPKAQSLKPND